MKHLLKTIITLLVVIAFFACNQQKKETGLGIISGNLINNSNEAIADSTITVQVGYPILEQSMAYSAKLSQDGTFAVEFPLLCPVYATVSTSLGDYQILTIPEKETKMEIIKNEEGVIEIKMLKGEKLSPENSLAMSDVSMEIIENILDETNLEPYGPNMLPNDYRDYVIRRTKKDISPIDENSILSEDVKDQMRNTMYLQYFFMAGDYAEAMQLAYQNQHPEEKVDLYSLSIMKPDRSYYSFLRHFELNNPNQFYPDLYVNCLQTVLKDSILAIPDIGDSPVDEWIKNVKTILSDLVGFDQGPFYDYLAANAYVKQFNTKLETLSDVQKENIKAYFRNPSFATLLFKENTKIEGIASLVTNPTPDVPKEKLLETIVSSYKGKVVVVDFWATWCSPCINAMNQSKALKETLNNEDIVFVYIAGHSSAEAIWKRRIMETEGGEHYYLNKENWQYIMNNLNGSGIPHYLLYDKSGDLINEFSGYPGNDKMKKLIMELI